MSVKKLCTCCCEAMPCDSGVVCSNVEGGHFFCSVSEQSCLETMLLASLPKLRTSGGDIVCSQCKFTLSLQDIAKHTSPTTWFRVNSAVVEAKVQKRLSDDEKVEKVNVVTKLLPNLGSDKSKAGDEVIAKLAHLYACQVREGALNLACPDCTAVYADFDGCMALSCQSCSSHFCGFCHKSFEFSSAAHKHVKECVENPSKGTYFANPTVIRQSQRRWRIQKVRSYLRDLNRIMHDKVVFELKGDLKDLGISVSDLDLNARKLREQDIQKAHSARSCFPVFCFPFRGCRN